MNITTHFKFDLLKIRNTQPPKILLDTDFWSTTYNECSYSYSSHVVAVYDSHQLNFIQHLEIWIDFSILNKHEDFHQDINSTVVINIPLNELVPSDTQNAGTLASLYAARLLIEITKLCSDLFSWEEHSYVEASLSNIELEPITAWGLGDNYPVLSAIDHITSENHKSFFAFFSEIISKIIPVKD